MRLTYTVLALAIAGCHSASETSVPPSTPAPAAAGAATTTIILHGVTDDWKLTAAQPTLLGNSVTSFHGNSPHFEGRPHPDGAAIECTRNTLCRIAIFQGKGRRTAASTFMLVTADPHIEAHVSLSPDPGQRPANPRFVQPSSRSAQLAALLQAESELVHACQAIPAGDCGGTWSLPRPDRTVPNHEPAEALAHLQSLVGTEDHDLATWAYFNAGCPDAPEDATHAREALRGPIDPLAPNVFPVGLARAILAAGGPAEAEARLDAMQAPAEAELAAALLRELIEDARQHHDFDRAAALRTKQLEGEGAWKDSQRADKLFATQSIIGAPAGSIPLRTLDGDPRDPAEMRGTPILVYSAASWCKPCRGEPLTELRAVATQYPDLQILYILWDDPEQAAAYTKANAPIPGTVVLPTEQARQKLEILLGSPSFPSYLLLDPQGQIAALPGDEDLETTLRAAGTTEDRAK